MATASPSQDFWADEAQVILTALYSADEAKTVLELWRKNRTREIQQVLLDAQAAGRDGREAILQVEARLQSEFNRKMAAAQARIPENSETQQTALSVVDGSPEETSAQSLSQEGARIVDEYQLDCNTDIKAQAIRAFRALFPEAASAVNPTYTEMRRALTTRIEALLAVKVIDTVSYKTYLSGMHHPTRDDGLNGRQPLQWEWAFNKAIAIWLATQMATPENTTDDEDSHMEDSQRVSSSDGAEFSCEASGLSSVHTEMIEVDPTDPKDMRDTTVIPDSQEQAEVVKTIDKPASLVQCDVSEAPVASRDSSHTPSGPQAPVLEVGLTNSFTVDPVIPDAKASGSPHMA